MKNFKRRVVHAGEYKIGSFFTPICGQKSLNKTQLYNVISIDGFRKLHFGQCSKCLKKINKNLN